jgi:hypothetical protein
VFLAFGIEAPPHISAIRHQAAEEKRKLKKEAQGAKAVGGTPATAQLEQKKEKIWCKNWRTTEADSRCGHLVRGFFTPEG